MGFFVLITFEVILMGFLNFFLKIQKFNMADQGGCHSDMITKKKTKNSGLKTVK